MPDVAIPLSGKFCKCLAGLRIYDHLGHVSGRKSSAGGPLPPVAILRDLNAPEWPNGIENLSPHREVPAASVAITANIQLEAIAKDALVGLDWFEPCAAGSDAYIAPDYGSASGLLKMVKDRLDPISVCNAIGVDEGKNAPWATETPRFLAGPGPGCGSCTTVTCG